MTEHPATATPDAAAGSPDHPIRIVDALGKACPLPVIWLAKAVAETEVGQDVVVLADDAGAKVDIPVWCRMRQQEFRGVREHGSGWRFTVRKIR